MHGDALQILRAGHHSKHLQYLYRIPVIPDSPSFESCHGLLSRERRRGHLPAGHSVYAVINKYYRYILAAISRVDYFGRAYRGQIPVALIRKYDIAGENPLYAGRDCRRPPVRGFCNVKVPIVVCYDSAPNPSHAYDSFSYSEFVDRLADKPMHYAMAASGAVMQLYVAQALWTGKGKDFLSFSDCRIFYFL